MGFVDDYINDQLKLAAIAGDLNKSSLLRELLNARNRAERAEAALERARAVERQLRIASDDPRASYETSRAYERAANDLAAALAEGGRP